MPHFGGRASSSHGASEAERYPDFRRRSGHGNKEKLCLTAEEAAENREKQVHGDIRGHGKGGGDIAGRKR
ncbi:hypothetical protein GCWU000341_02413 [Oribacterium sp. oral taxon 078 str. F0262]|nr:hypothetical protein GCWU000341_02413 [Oribacterium sp. oral taxon 078 str. F0262]